LKYLSQFFRFLGSFFSTNDYYYSLNESLKKIDGRYTMLHYPLDGEDTSTFIQAQKNLTDFCLLKLPDLKDKVVLEIGCGNGVQGLYIYEKHMPGSFKGVDLNDKNIMIANGLAVSLPSEKIHFLVDDAQKLVSVKDNSVDIVINIESACHYPDKQSFISEVHRVLKSGGHFIIADILTKSEKKKNPFWLWKRRKDLNHWPLFNYLKSIKQTGLQLLITEDITALIIEGFQKYKNWIPNLKANPIIEKLMLRIFFYANVKLSVRLLKTRRSYYLFHGIKS
jgi:ubiquinone/menaquinone biosynthesis C-methylase UbiE